MPTVKLRLGTTAWFQMVGELMSEAATRSGLPAELNVSFVERYMDGVELSKGAVQGIRFDIVDGETVVQGWRSSWRARRYHY